MFILVSVELGLFLLAKERKKDVVEMAPTRKERERPENVPPPEEPDQPAGSNKQNKVEKSQKKNK